MKFPAILESWQYRNPEAIADGLIARTVKVERIEKRKAELELKHKRRLRKSQLRIAKQKINFHAGGSIA